MIQDMKDLQGKGPVELLLYDPVAILSSATSVESVEALMVGLMAYWKTLDSETQPNLYQQAASIYAKAMLRRKALAQPGKAQPLLEAKQSGATETDQLLAEIGKTPLLKPDMQTFHDLVASHIALTFEEATERLTQGMMGRIISLYGDKVPSGGMGYFIEQIAKTLEFKRKIILAGKVGQAYKAIWLKAGGQVVQALTDPLPLVPVPVTSATLVPVPKKPKKVKALVEPAEALPFWRNVTELCAVIFPACGASHLVGLTIGAVSPSTEQSMLAFAKKEVLFFYKSSSINLPLAVGKYNFLMTLFANPVSVMPLNPNQLMADLEGTQYVIDVEDSVVRVRLTGEVPV